METENISTIEYRLEAIENTLAELKSVLLDSKLQEKEIETINQKINDLFTKASCLKKRVEELESRPYKSGNERWKLIIDTIIKLVITGAVTFLLIKIGFPVA